MTMLYSWIMLAILLRANIDYRIRLTKVNSMMSSTKPVKPDLHNDLLSLGRDAAVSFEKWQTRIHLDAQKTTHFLPFSISDCGPTKNKENPTLRERNTGEYNSLFT